MYSVERIERGPKCMDRSSAEYDGYKAEKAERELYDGFMGAVENGDANALCAWAPFVHDDEARKARGLLWTDKNLPKRPPTLAECMAESLDYGDGPSMTEAMQLIVNVATGCDESTTAQARRLLERMADSFARHNC